MNGVLTNSSEVVAAYQRALSNKTYKEFFIVKLVLTVLETLRHNGKLKSL